MLVKHTSAKVYIGNNTVIGRNNIITAKNLIRIDNDVLMGSDVQIIDHSHGIARDELIRNQRAEIGEVIIADDVWIGAGAKILMNAHIESRGNFYVDITQCWHDKEQYALTSRK